MNKINYQLEARFNQVLSQAKKMAEKWGNLTLKEAIKIEMNSQVRYKRKGYSRNDMANHYHDGNLCLESLDRFDHIGIQKISRRAFDYTGYYADNFQCELIKPYIVRIKTNRGLFIAPAISYSDSDMATIYLSQGGYIDKTQDFEREYEAWAYTCAGRADRIAEREAEKAREDDAKWQAESQTDDLKAENLEARKEAHELILAIKAQKNIGEIVTPICNALISKIQALRQSIRRNNKRIGVLKADCWQAVI